jgi:hypothetical protein
MICVMWRRLLSTSARTAAPVVVTRQAGVINTTEYRLFFDRTDVGAPAKAATVSPWHDIPLRPTAIDSGAVDALHFNYVNEIPKGCAPHT